MGYEVWNKQRKDEVLLDVEDVALGHVTRMRWNDSTDWVTSAEPTHEPIISRETFGAAQAMFDGAKRTSTRTPRVGHVYALAGRMRCGACGRRMQGQWNHGRAYYRCKFDEEHPNAGTAHPRNIYVKESSLLGGLDRCLAAFFDDDHIDDTCEQLAGVSEPDPVFVERQAALTAAIADCDRKLNNYRKLLDNEDTVPVAAEWIADTQRERRRLEQQLGHQVAGDQLTADEVKALVTALKNIVNVLDHADIVDKADLYEQLGVELTYHPNGRVSVESLPRGVKVRVGGGT